MTSFSRFAAGSGRSLLTTTEASNSQMYVSEHIFNRLSIFITPIYITHCHICCLSITSVKFLEPGFVLKRLFLFLFLFVRRAQENLTIAVFLERINVTSIP